MSGKIRENDMKNALLWIQRQIVFALVILLAIPLGVVASAQEAPANVPRPISSPPVASLSQQPTEAPTQVASLPDSPNPVFTQTAPAEAASQTTAQQQTTPSQPLGTAAAPAEPANGVAASRPAGAAIAPAKQKRSRTLAIRVGLLVGAAVAIGTVVALSSASPSRP
jgi:hypothetical protein